MEIPKSDNQGEKNIETKKEEKVELIKIPTEESKIIPGKLLIETNKQAENLKKENKNLVTTELESTSDTGPQNLLNQQRQVYSKNIKWQAKLSSHKMAIVYAKKQIASSPVQENTNLQREEIKVEPPLNIAKESPQILSTCKKKEEIKFMEEKKEDLKPEEKDKKAQVEVESQEEESEKSSEPELCLYNPLISKIELKLPNPFITEEKEEKKEDSIDLFEAFKTANSLFGPTAYLSSIHSRQETPIIESKLKELSEDSMEYVPRTQRKSVNPIGNFKGSVKKCITPGHR